MKVKFFFFILGKCRFFFRLLFSANLEILECEGLQLDEWRNTFPLNLHSLIVPHSNFKGDLSYLISLQIVDLTNIKHHDWTGNMFNLQPPSIDMHFAFKNWTFQTRCKKCRYI